MLSLRQEPKGHFALADELQGRLLSPAHGFAEWDDFISSKENTPLVRYLKLTNPVNILTRGHFYELPEIKQKLDKDFKGIASLVALMHTAIKHRTPSEEAD